jgi:recombination protein RecT
METQVATQPQNGVSSPITAKSLFDRDDVKKKFQELLGKRSSSFMTSVLQIVASNDLLKKADPTSIYQSAAVAATLDMPLNNSLGFAYIVPYNQSYKDEKGQWQKKQVAQFQIGYKGFIQLAQRSGQFLTLGATHITDKDTIKGDRLLGNSFELSKEAGAIVGYAAYFKLLNGFEKVLYMTVDELKQHGLKYSQTYKNPDTKKSSKWETDFDAMATKTVIKLLLSKYAPLSVEMQNAVIVDQSVVNNADTLDVTYLDNEDHPVDKEAERIALMIEDATSLEQLDRIKEHVLPEQMDLFHAKAESLKPKAK